MYLILGALATGDKPETRPGPKLLYGDNHRDQVDRVQLRYHMTQSCRYGLWNGGLHKVHIENGGSKDGGPEGRDRFGEDR